MKDLKKEDNAKLLQVSMNLRTAQVLMLRGTIDRLLRWILNYVYPMTLPCDCQIFPSGDFVRTTPLDPSSGKSKEIFRMKIGDKHDVLSPEAFCRLIDDGFINELNNALIRQSEHFSKTFDEISSALAGSI
jgi:hypothetical protein